MGTYCYQLKQIDYDGQYECITIIRSASISGKDENHVGNFVPNRQIIVVFYSLAVKRKLMLV
ncbi:MAG: hypothetical protein R2836_06850 [Chitinophagales bacterium]